MSQFDEDTHILAILDEIGHGSKVLADIGARYEGSNSAQLIEKHGWTGVLVDASRPSAEELRGKFPQCDVRHLVATPHEINRIVPRNAHFLSIDVDSTDWWLWANLTHRPALVVIETNPNDGIHVAAMGGQGYGCSVDAAKALGTMKGYTYVGRTAVNAFFVRADIPCGYRLPDHPRHRGTPSTTAGRAI